MSTDGHRFFNSNPDVVRLSLQSAIAGTLAALVVRTVGTGEVFLAVISAVLVLQPNRDATIESAAERLAGALIGTIVGMAALVLTSPGAIPWPLAIAMLVMGGLAAWKPGLRYGIVAAAGLAIGSELGFVDTAVNRGTAIFVGAIAGIAVGSLVIPETAARRAGRQLSEALRLCEQLLQGALKIALQAEDAQLSALHARFSAVIGRAADSTSSIAIANAEKRDALGKAVHATRRLWHAIIILDRITEERDEDAIELSEDVRRSIHHIREQAAQALNCLAEFRPAHEHVLKGLMSECGQAEKDASAAEQGPLSSAALLFGLREVSRNISEIDDAVRAVNREQA